MIIADCYFQAGLAFNTNVAVSDVRHGITNNHAVVSDTATFPTSIALWWKSKKGSTAKLVGDPHHRRIQISYQHPVYLESYLPRHQGAVSDARICSRGSLASRNISPRSLSSVRGDGKTSVALTVLHHERIKERFGTKRQFIRCDQFPISRAHFLSRLSNAIGAGVENPEDLTPLRPFLPSRKVILILDPQPGGRYGYIYCGGGVKSVRDGGH